MKTKNKWNKIAGYLSGEMNNEQHEKFLLELKDNQPLKKDYELMKKTWKKYDSNPAKKYTHTADAWKSLNERMRQDGMIDSEDRTIRMDRRQYFLRVAAVIVMVLSVGVTTVLYTLKQPGSQNATIEHKSSEGILTVDLPDGSRVFLNENSELEYHKDFSTDRKVSLKGEGFFNVMSDPDRPFKVNTGKAIVTVLGTSFNVKEAENKEVEVYVKSGRVQLSLEEKDENLILEPGEMGVAGNEIRQKVNEDENYLSWQTKDFKFLDESVDNILQVLQKAYHVEVKAEELDLSKMRLTTSYSNQSFDAIMNTMCTALNLQFSKKGKVYILHSN